MTTHMVADGHLTAEIQPSVRQQPTDENQWEMPNCTGFSGFKWVSNASHHLPAEEGRFLNLPRASRVCNLCNTGASGDDRHMLLECPALADLRLQFF